MVVDRNWEGEAGEADGRRTWSKDGLVDIIEYSDVGRRNEERRMAMLTVMDAEGEEEEA